MKCRRNRSLRLGHARVPRGFSLLEVLLAIAIFGAGMAVLYQLINTGVEAAVEARDQSRAQILCETKLEELMLQNSTPISIPESALDTGDPNRVWSYMVEVQPAAVSSMHAVRVTVRAAPPGTTTGREASFSLVRWVPDYSLGLDTPMSTETTTTTTENTTTTSGGTSP